MFEYGPAVRANLNQHCFSCRIIKIHGSAWNPLYANSENAFLAENVNILWLDPIAAYVSKTKTCVFSIQAKIAINNCYVWSKWTIPQYIYVVVCRLCVPYWRKSTLCLQNILQGQYIVFWNPTIGKNEKTEIPRRHTPIAPLCPLWNGVNNKCSLVSQ